MESIVCLDRIVASQMMVCCHCPDGLKNSRDVATRGLGRKPILDQNGNGIRFLESLDAGSS